MQTIKIEPFKVIGITVRTTNENGQAAQDIGQLWGRFMSEGLVNKIPNKMEESIYSIYTNYEKDFTRPYDVILGCKVGADTEVPEGMVAKTFDGGTYTKFLSKGDLTKGAVYNTWLEIWNSNLKRAYSADFEVYGEKSQNPTDAEVDIFIAVE
jgi:predicted transcriptional regulator YdeE